MKEFNIEIEIDENGNITADTRGSEYFAKEQIVSKANIKSKLQ